MDRSNWFSRLWRGAVIVASVLAFMASVASIVKLAEYGFRIDLFGPFKAFADEYEFWMELLIGSWAEPPMRALLRLLAKWTGWSVELGPHWKHIFVVMWLYFGASARAASAVGAWATAVFYVVWGGLVALAAGVATGTVDLHTSSDSFGSNVTVVSSFVFGIVLFELGRSVWGAYRHGGSEGWWKAMIEDTGPFNAAVASVGVLSLFVYWLATFLRVFDPIPSPGLAYVALLAVILASYYVFVGLHTPAPAVLEASTLRKFRHLRADDVGLSVLIVVGGATVFLISNAGLRLFST